jgi:outer membrane protein OmpA-like peptidoglycan-associated protein
MKAKRLALAAALALAASGTLWAQESTGESPPEQPAPAVDQPPEAAAEQPAAEAAPVLPPGLEEFLADGRPSADLSERDLKQRLRRGAALLKAKALPADARANIAARVKDDRVELQRRAAAANEPAAQPEAKPAEEKKAEEQPQEATPEAKPAMPAEVAEFLADTRPSKSLPADDLKARIERAKGLLALESLSGDARVELRRRLARAQAELDRRTAAATSEPPPQAPAPEPGVETAGDGELQEFEQNRRPLAQLSDEELTQRIAKGRVLLKRQDLKPESRALLRREVREAAVEAQRRKEGGKQTVETPPAQPSTDQPAATNGEPAEPPEADIKILSAARPSSEMSEAELKARLKVTKRIVQGDYSPRWRQEARRLYIADRAELKRRSQTAQQPPASPADQKLDANPVSAEAEAAAAEFLRGSARVDSLDDRQLRQRLDAMRDLLQRNLLSPATERTLRERLASEREVLRTRVAQREAEKAPAAKPGRKKKIDFDTNITVVLGDRRPSEELDDDELRRRIDIYRDAADDADYDDEERGHWRQTMDYDRRVLRERMLRERESRAREYRRRRESNEDFDIEFDVDAPRRPSVWAAESDDEDIESALVAAPRRKVERRYTIDDIERDEDLRAAMPALEIDTVRFGFNESFLREEEIARLDRIAEVIEKILALRPYEVFLVEGHTDAVGSDAYNLELSRKRANAVKEALTSYYVIPARNLKTVGYGERFLKIPTADEEPENRRVSLRRVTPLVGELQD